MSADTLAPAALAGDATEPEAERAASEWLATGLTVLFAAVAVLLTSFLAVVTNLG